MRRAALAFVFAAALAVWGAPTATMAQDATPPSATPPGVTPDESITDSHLRAAGRLIELIGGDVTFDDILPRVAMNTQTVFTRTNPALTREIEEAVSEAAISMVPRRLELARTLELIWARRFSEDELTQLSEFFSGPLGTKYVEMFPIVSALSLGAAKQWEQIISADMVTATRENLEAAGHTL